MGLGLAGAARRTARGRRSTPANNNIANTASLQRGAKYFVNYCLGCHSAKYVRYNRLAQDLQLSEQQLIDNLMFTGERPFDTMANAMQPEDSERWFGIAPPDLSLIARSRGTDYIYTFLRSFYAAPRSPDGRRQHRPAGHRDAARAVGAARNAARRVRHRRGARRRGGIRAFRAGRPGELGVEEFDSVVRDIVNFLDYIGEPIKRERQQLGIRVIGFLLVFLLIAYMLKKEIWKDVK